MDACLLSDLQERSRVVRRDVVGMLGMARAGCLGASLSTVDILVWLYGAVLNVQPSAPFFEGRDRFVLSRTASAPALYATLAERGFFPRDELWGYRRLGSLLQPSPEYRRTPGVDVSCGNPGMGPGVAAGLALALRLQGVEARVFCLMGVEEMSSGSVWEAFSELAVSEPMNLTLIVNCEIGKNGDLSGDVKAETALAKRIESFGLPIAHADGHDMAAMEDALASLSSQGFLLLRTLWGKGIPSLEVSSSHVEQLLDRQTTERLLGELEGKRS